MQRSAGGGNTIGQMLREVVQRSPSRPFFYVDDRVYSYEKLDELSDRFATALLEHGVQKGDRIAILAYNQPEWLIAFFAAAKIGAAVVALSVRYRDTELEYMLNQSKVKLLVSIDATPEFCFRDFFASFREKIPTVQQFVFIGEGFPGSLSFDELLKTDRRPDLLAEAGQACSECDTMSIIYTSGTTGRPKGALLTHKSMLASARAQAAHFDIQETDITAAHMPFNHVGGLTCAVLTALVSRSSLVLIPNFRPDLVLEAIDKYRITVFGGVPTMFVMMFNMPRFHEFDVSSVRLCIAGGSNVEPQLCREIVEKFPSTKLVNLYGLSETSGACIISPMNDSLEKVMQSIGKPIGDFQAKVIGKDGEELPPGEIGELAIQGACVVAGYDGLEDATKEAFSADGWLYTGDMAYLDEEGYVYLKGRKKEMYIQGGFNVYPVEIENLLTTHPKVAIAAGIGIPDPVFGEVGRYYILPKAGYEVTEDELLAFCRQHLADYKVPRQFVIVDDLPLTPAGKVQKSLLKQMAAAEFQSSE